MNTELIIILHFTLGEFKECQEQYLFIFGEVTFGIPGRLSVKFPEAFYNNSFICALFREKIPHRYMLRNNRHPLNAWM